MSHNKGYALGYFPISSRILNEILYDYLSNDVKPKFSVCPDKEIVRISCLKCCKIIKNETQTRLAHLTHQWKKHVWRIELVNTIEFIKAQQDKTYYEFEHEFEHWKTKKIETGHYQFQQLSNREQFILANQLFEQHRATIPRYFWKCIKGECS